MVHPALNLAILLVVHVAIIDSQGISLKISGDEPCVKCGLLGLGSLPLNQPSPPGRIYTQNWSGVARDADGSTQGVFSGASARFVGDAQATGAAFALDSSSTGDSNKNFTGNFNKETSYQYQSHGGKNIGVEGYNQGSQQSVQGFSDQNQKLKQGLIGNEQQQLNDFGTSNTKNFYKSYYGSQRTNQIGNGLANGGTVPTFAKEYQSHLENEGPINNGQQQQTNDFVSSNDQSFKESYQASKGHNKVGNGLEHEGAVSFVGKENQLQGQNQGFVGNDQQLQQSNKFWSSNVPSSNEFYQTGQGEHKVDNLEFGGVVSSISKDNQFNKGKGQQQRLNGLGVSHGQSSYESDQVTYGKDKVGNGYNSATSVGEGNQFHGQNQLTWTHANSQQEKIKQQQQLQQTDLTNDVQVDQSNGQIPTADLAFQNGNKNEYGIRDGSLTYGASSPGAGLGLESTLRGALELASQGLSASQQTSYSCPTCGKSSLALSNAKSKTGSAISLSING